MGMTLVLFQFFGGCVMCGRAAEWATGAQIKAFSGKSTPSLTGPAVGRPDDKLRRGGTPVFRPKMRQRKTRKQFPFPTHGNRLSVPGESVGMDRSLDRIALGDAREAD